MADTASKQTHHPPHPPRPPPGSSKEAGHKMFPNNSFGGKELSFVQGKKISSEDVKTDLVTQYWSPNIARPDICEEEGSVQSGILDEGERTVGMEAVSNEDEGDLVELLYAEIAEDLGDQSEHVEEELGGMVNADLEFPPDLIQKIKMVMVRQETRDETNDTQESSSDDTRGRLKSPDYGDNSILIQTPDNNTMIRVAEFRGR